MFSVGFLFICCNSAGVTFAFMASAIFFATVFCSENTSTTLLLYCCAQIGISLVASIN